MIGQLALIDFVERGALLGFLSNLRDVKSSLASGMILLFTLWLIFANEIGNVGSDDSVAGNLRSLLEYVGSAGTLGLVVFVAYVAGMVLTSHAWMDVVISRIDRFFPGRARWPRSEAVSEQTRLRLESYLGGIFWEASKESTPDEILKVLNLPATPELEKRIDEARTVYERREEMRRQAVSLIRYHVLSSLEILAVQLHSKKERSWDRYDKALAESEFRAGIAGPIGFLGLVLAWRSATEQHWVLAAVTLVVSLAVASSLALKARRKRQEATEEIINAVIVGDLEVGPIAKITQTRSEASVPGRSSRRGNFLRRMLRRLPKLSGP